jgi:hypothetical protein
VDDHARRDRAYLIERFASLIALQRPDVDAFVKPSVNNSGRRFDRIADESILTAFLRRRFHPLVVGIDVLINVGFVDAIIGIVICGWRGSMAQVG